MKPSRRMIHLPSAARVAPLAALSAVLVLGAGRARAQTAASPSTTTAAVATAPMPMPITDNQVFAHALFNQLELRPQGPDTGLRWDGEAWIGSDLNRVWFKSEGTVTRGPGSAGEIEALYDRPLPRLRYFDGQIGFREDIGAGPPRTWLALGVEGLAPGFFEFEPTLYLGRGGRVAGRISGLYDLLLTQRLVAQPQLEMNFYGTPDPSRRLGTGLSDVDTGLRVRYEFSRKFAPYVGFTYARKYGGTAALARRAGEKAAGFTFVLGLRVWY